MSIVTAIKSIKVVFFRQISLQYWIFEIQYCFLDWHRCICTSDKSTDEPLKLLIRCERSYKVGSENRGLFERKHVLPYFSETPIEILNNPVKLELELKAG